MKNLSTILCVVWIIISLPTTMANDIVVSSVSLENQNITDHYCIVEFNLNWDNSWRTSSVPQNWDAAWVFVKYSVAGGEWNHATLNSANVAAPSGSTIDFVGTTGVFIYRDSDGSGTNNWWDVGLRWDYGTDGVADDASVEVRVFAIEMVYVPQSSFYLGDGAASNRYYQATDNTQPYLVDGTTITFNLTAGNLWAVGTSGISMGDIVPSTYPTGYEAFYCMKYEISQEQYVDFLNTLTRDQQNEHTQTDVSGDVINGVNQFVMSAIGAPQNRNGISCPLSGLGTTDPITFFCDLNDNMTGNESMDGHNLPCNYISWMDVAAYADWSGLRPLTEAEYEKASRGPNNSVGNEYAWGNAVYNTTVYTLNNSGYPNESIIGMGTGIGHMQSVLNGITILGPVRCGIFAAGSTNHTRIETGATYYGIMEMSANVDEMTVCMHYDAGLSFTGLHGNGTLLTDGLADVDFWPGINGNFDFDTDNTAYSTGGVSSNGGMVLRGGSFDSVTATAEISNRASTGTSNNTIGRLSTNGARLVRTAP